MGIFAASTDLGAIKARYGFSQEGLQQAVDFSSAEVRSVRPSAGAISLAPAWQPPPLPKRFVSGSTPENLSQRYLVIVRRGAMDHIKYISEVEPCRHHSSLQY